MTKLNDMLQDRAICLLRIVIIASMASPFGVCAHAQPAKPLKDRISVVGTRQYSDRVSRLKVTPEAARKLILERMKADGTSVRHTEICLIDDKYVFSFNKEKHGMRLAGYLVDGNTGEVTDTGRDQIDTMLGGEVRGGVIRFADFEEIKKANDQIVERRE
jgi:hypothetical protein